MVLGCPMQPGIAPLVHHRDLDPSRTRRGFWQEGSGESELKRGARLGPNPSLDLGVPTQMLDPQDLFEN